jgi:hypothetical protein
MQMLWNQHIDHLGSSFKAVVAGIWDIGHRSLKVSNLLARAAADIVYSHWAKWAAGGVSSQFALTVSV